MFPRPPWSGNCNGRIGRQSINRYFYASTDKMGKKRTYSILFRTILLSVYAVFFSVQFFFNFDGPEPGNGQTILSYSNSVHQGPGQPPVLRRTALVIPVPIHTTSG